MYKRQAEKSGLIELLASDKPFEAVTQTLARRERGDRPSGCLLYTSDAADERSSVDLGGRRLIKKTNELT